MKGEKPKKMIQEEYVGIKTAKLLKWKGFDEDCLKRYSLVNVKGWRGDTIVDISKNGRYLKTEIDITDSINCPTQQMAMRWLREKHHIHIMVDCLGSSNYLPTIQITNSSKDVAVEGSESRIGGNGFDTYEEAVESALQYVLRNFKNLKK